MTGLFLWPLLRTRFRNHQLRRISRRTVTAATIVLGTSTANICGLVIRHGVERGFACLAAWECDVSSPYSTNSPSFSKYQQKPKVLIGSIALFWLTSGNSLRPNSSAIHAAPLCSSNSCSSPTRLWKEKSLPELSQILCPETRPYEDSLSSPVTPEGPDDKSVHKEGGVVALSLTLPSPAWMQETRPRSASRTSLSLTPIYTGGMPSPELEVRYSHEIVCLFVVDR